MFRKISNWLNIQPQEIKVFLWAVGLLFMIRTAGIWFNNFAETMFLKRFGVEYLPMVYMANAVTTFVIMGAMTGVMRRLSSARLLSYMLVFCGISVALLRPVVSLDFAYIYPLLFLLKAQYEALHALVFWNLANDLFNTRQSKRIFPLITAGGVLGGILGSFATPYLARWITLNNLMVAYLGACILGAWVVWRIDNLFPVLELPERKARKAGKRKGMMEELRQIWPMLKDSTLIKVMVLITFLPNILIPIMNYQFNFAVNETFQTEGGLLAFFGWFRGALNSISLVILLFVGRVYARWGLPVALMFHPANYVIAFAAFLLHFNLVSAMYARISTNVLRETINNPARNILMGLFPAETRPLLRPFLRGTVVRVGILLGSGCIMISEGWLHPRYLSVVGLVVGAAWVLSVVWLKRSYTDILLDLISSRVLDLKSLESTDLGQMFTDKKAQDRLVRACLDSQGQACVLYAEMMKAQSVPGLEDHLLSILPQRDEETIKDLLPLLPAGSGAKAIPVLQKLADPARPGLTTALVNQAARLDPVGAREFLVQVLEGDHALEVKARAARGLYESDPARYQSLIDRWLASDQLRERKAGVVAVGQAAGAAMIPRLRELLDGPGGADLAPELLAALARLQDPELDHLVLAQLARDPLAVPLEVLAGLNIVDQAGQAAFIRLLGSEDPERAQLAQDKLAASDYQEPGQLIKSLALPNRRLRERLYALLETLKISDREIVDFSRQELAKAYHELAVAQGLLSLEVAGPSRDLLAEHYQHKMRDRVDNLLRVLATQEDSDQMRVVMRGLSSSDQRMRSNSVEALENLLGSSLARTLVPLLEDQSLDERLRAGRRLFDLPKLEDQPGPLLELILAQEDWTGQALALRVMAELGMADQMSQPLERLGQAGNVWVSRAAQSLLHPPSTQSPPGEVTMPATTDLTERILLLRKMELFETLSVNELSAVASVTEDVVLSPQEQIIEEGEVGESMFLIVSGRVKVHKKADAGCDVDLATMGPGEYFGEMALFEGETRSASVSAVEETHLMALHKREFSETVREYPQVALQICKEMSRRLRQLHQKIRGMPICEVNPQP